MREAVTETVIFGRGRVRHECPYCAVYEIVGPLGTLVETVYRNARAHTYMSPAARKVALEAEPFSVIESLDPLRVIELRWKEAGDETEPPECKPT